MRKKKTYQKKKESEEEGRIKKENEKNRIKQG